MGQRVDKPLKMSRLNPRFWTRKRARWQRLADELDGKYIPGRGIRKSDTVAAPCKNWTILFDCPKRGKRRYTRVRAAYVNRDSFTFRIYRRRAYSGIQKKFGLEDIEIGIPEFDAPFIIQSNDPRKVKLLLKPERIREIIGWQPEIWLHNQSDPNWVTDTWREGVSELHFEVPGVIQNLQRLHDLYQLFEEILWQLCQVGSAYKDNPLSR